MLTFLTNFQTLCAKCANLLMQQLNTDCCSTRTTSHFFGGRWRTTLEMMQFFDKKKAGRIFYSLFYCIMHKVYIKKKKGKEKLSTKSSFLQFYYFVELWIGLIFAFIIGLKSLSKTAKSLKHSVWKWLKMSH